MKPTNHPPNLERYFKVEKNKTPARYRISKRVAVGVDFGSETESLWSAHEKGMRRQRDLLAEVDEGKENIEELEIPEKSLLDLKSKIADRILESCRFCERKCRANRMTGGTGLCGVGKDAKIASKFVHRGEEPELVPSYTVFFSGCTFVCQYCQNWDISQTPETGVTMSPGEICSSIERAREKGVRNVNWVGGDPTPNLHNILASLNACDTNIPSVWNSNMYLTKEAMRLLSGTQDVYLTDFKYGNDECAEKYSKIRNYWNVTTRNHKMAFDDAEVIIRHLVLPDHLGCCTEKIMKWVRDELGRNVRFNLMGQYRPAGRAEDYPELSRRVSGKEMNQAMETAEEIGLENVIR